MKKRETYGKDHDLNLSVLISLSRAAQVVQRSATRVFQRGGLSLTQFGVLEALYHKGPLTIDGLLKSLLATSGNLTVVINNLEKQQLIVRSVHPTDRRCSLINITEAGETKVRDLFPQHLAYLEQRLDSLTATEKETLVFLLKKAGKATGNRREIDGNERN